MGSESRSLLLHVGFCWHSSVSSRIRYYTILPTGALGKCLLSEGRGLLSLLPLADRRRSGLPGLVFEALDVLLSPSPLPVILPAQ